MKSEMGWLPGCPVRSTEGVVEWLHVPREGGRELSITRLDRHAIHGATNTWSRLVNRFPRVLPHLVDDVPLWKSSLPRLLGRLKEAIHDGKPLPRSLLDEASAFAPADVRSARRTVTGDPRVRAFVEAQTWLTYLYPVEFGAAVSWARANAALIDDVARRHELRAVLAMYELHRRDTARRVRPLVEFLAHPQVATCPAQGATAYIEQLRARVTALKRRLPPQPLPTRPPGDVGEHVCGFLAWLAGQDRGPRRRALEMCSWLLSPALLEARQAWWTDAESLALKIARARRDFQHEHHRRVIDKFIARVVKLEGAAPAPLNVPLLLQYIQRTSLGVNEHLHKSLVGALPRMPIVHSGKLARASFVHECLTLIDDGRRESVALVSELAAHLKRGADLWRAWVEPQRIWHKRSWGLIFTVCMDEFPPARRRQLFQAIEWYARSNEGELTPSIGGLLATLVAAPGSAEDACERLTALQAANDKLDYLNEDAAEAAANLSEDAAGFAAVYQALSARDAFGDHDREALMAAQHTLARAGWGHLLRDTIVDGRAADLSTLITRLTACHPLKCNPSLPSAPEQPESPDWASTYPPPLRASAAALNALDSAAQAKCDRILKGIIHDPARLDDEIDALQQLASARPQDDRLRTRLARLRQQRAVPTTPSAKQIRKAVARIDRATRSAAVRQLEAWSRSALAAAVSAQFGSVDESSPLLDDRHIRALSAALNLGDNHKRLAMQLFRRRCGDPPWRPLEHEANQAFAARMADRGLSLDPWLDAASCEWGVGDANRLTVGFEDDPLEIFQMGAPFGTCLTPGDFNFFSTLANAADINKRVLYARDDAGRIEGRCLFALSDGGGLLVFHAYCTNNSLPFGQYVATLAVDLARRMNTVVVKSGHVSCLVSDDWYDDGAKDIAERFEALREGSSFRAHLDSIEPAAIRMEVERAFAPVPLNGLTLSLLLELDEFVRRPSLLPPLAGELEQAEGLAAWLWHRVVRLAYEAGDDALARRVFHRHLIPVIRNRKRQDGWCYGESAQVIAHLDPTVAIRLVRQTRSRGIRRDEDEPEPARRRILGLALRRLGRERRARVLLGKEDTT